MQIEYTGQHIEVTPALKAFSDEKFAKLSRHFNHGMIAMHVIFSVQKRQQKVEATILIKNAEIHAHADAIDMYTAIDLLVDKLNRQLVKHKEKMQGKREGFEEA